MMRVILLACLGSLLVPALVQGQTQEMQDKVNYRLRELRAAAQQEGMYENIEIMRRILQRGLGSVYAPQVAGDPDSRAALASYFDGIGNPQVFGGDYAARVNANNGTAQLFDVYGDNGVTAIYGDLGRANYLSANQARHPYYQQQHAQTSSVLVEGVYLKGQGVVYTVTLPTHERVLLDPHSNQLLTTAYCAACHVGTFNLPAEKTAVPDKLPSLWEQTRREVKGQPKEAAKKPTADTKKLEVCGPGTVGDAVLRLLAENGKYLSLAGKESVTVVITFRPPAGGTTPSARYYPLIGVQNVEDMAPVAVDPNITGRVSNQGETRTAAADPAGQSTAANETKKDIKNTLAESWKQSYESLGDLHVKQKHFADAVEAYKKALSQSPEAKQQEAIRGKLLDALKAQLNAIDAMLADSKETQELRKKLLDSAAAYLKGLETELSKPGDAQAKKSTLPAKLIITAPKDLLDQIGQGKVSFEDFKKAASVEYLTFSSAK